MPRASSWGVLLTLLCCLLPVSQARPQLNQTRRVLILNDLSIISSPGFAEVDQAVLNGLQSAPYRVEVYHESLQLTLFPDEIAQHRFRELLIGKYSERKPDVIIAAGSASLKFIAESQERFIRDTPIIFCAVLGEIPEQLKSSMHFTGVLGKLHPSETLHAALHLIPGTKHVVVVGGLGEFDKGWEAVAKQAFQNYPSKLDFTYLTDLTMPVLLKRLEQLPSNTIVYYTSISQDAAGERFISSAQALPLVAAAANAPVFVMDDVDLRAGGVGGDLVNWAADGRVAAGMAVRVLNGEKPENVPVVSSRDAYMFDWSALKRWGIKESNLPSGSILLNQPPSFWELYRRYVIAGILVLVAESVAIFALLWQRAKRRQIAAELVWRLEFESLLSELSTIFINLPEELIDTEIKKSLAHLSEFLKLDSISLLEFSKDRQELVTICSWTAPKLMPAPLLDTDQLPWWKKQLLSGEVTLASNADSLPQGAFVERQYFRQTGITSAVSIPLEVRGEVNGAISFVAVRRQLLWTDDLINQLKVAGDIFWNALRRERAAAALSRSQSTLRESEERFRLVSNTAPVMIWMSDPDKLCTYFNAGWLHFTGRTAAEEAGNGWADGVHPDDLQRCWEIYSKSFDKRESFQMEYRLRRYDGEYRWVFDQGVPRFHAEGSFAGYIGSCIDVTDRKAAEEALSNVGRKLIEAHEEERTRIARELHDDFNQRITLLAVNLTALTKGLPVRYGQFNGALKDAIQQVGELGHDMQALAHRLHSSKLEYLGLTAACAGFCRELSVHQTIDIAFHSEGVPKKLPPEIALCLFRVLQEALQNAVKHSGTRRFEVSLIGGLYDIELTVKDAGIGFDPGAAMRGPGIGLTSMRERVKLVDGEFLLESQEQRGTTIQVRVPLAARAMAAKSSG